MRAIVFLSVLILMPILAPMLASLAGGTRMAAANPAQALAVDRQGGPAAPGAAHGAAGAAAPMLSQNDRAIYAKALRLAAARRFDEARRLSRSAQDPRLNKVILWLDLSTPREDEGDFPVIATFLAKNPDWPGRGALQLHAEMVLPQDLPDAQVLSWFGAHAPLSVAGAARYADALGRAGRSEEALDLVRATWTGRRFTRAQEAAFLARFGDRIRREDHEVRLDWLLWRRAFQPAKRQARRLGPGYVALSEARSQLARNRPGVDTAIRRVPQILQNDPGLVYERARWRQRRKRYPDVAALLDPPPATVPQPERWWSLRHWTVRQALLKGDMSIAYRIASQHGMTSGTGFAEAEWLAGWLALRFLDDPGPAYLHFTRLYGGVSTPVSLGRGAFWAGDAALTLAARSGDLAWYVRARNWYETASSHDTSYYGQLASRRLDRRPVIDLATRVGPSPLEKKSFESDELVTTVRLLDEVGAHDLMERFLFRLVSLAETGKDYALVADLAGSLGRPDLATRSARSARNDGIILPRYLFPSMALPDEPEPEQALLLALIRQESGFYPGAVSRAGARGLMQIMPATARQVARQIRVAYNGDKLLSDPDYNILLGRTYLTELLERFDGSYVLALAAYNAGPARAAGWIGAFGDPRDPGVDPIDWVESISIDETRNYVQRILESLGAYRQRLGTALSGAEGLPEIAPLVPPARTNRSEANHSCCL